MRIVINYEPDPDFSFCDEPGRSYVALETLLYDDAGKLVGSLSNSTFFEDSDDWTVGAFGSVEEIPERCTHLREVAEDLIADYEASTILYRLLDPRGATVEVGTCTIAEAGAKAARFIEAQASEGLAGSIEFTGSGLKRRK